MRRNFIGLNWGAERWVISALAALVAVLFYLHMSALTFRVGFPLDDSWIHLTYARNLAEHREWAFQPGQPSAGSTAPLWTVLLSMGFLLGLAPYVWTFLVGWIVLTMLAGYAEDLARALLASYRSRMPWVGLFFVGAWHLTWSAVSGMETLLHALIILTTLGTLMRGSRRYLSLGLLVGLSAWVRPDGLTLLGPILLVALLSQSNWHLRRDAIWKTLIGFGALFLPYVFFNLALSESPMPNTFYAKRAEYESFWQSKTLLERFGEYLFPIIASPFLVIIPGAFVWLRRRIRARDWGTVASLIWAAGYIGIYALNLPAYQHGRYIIPALPLLYVWGMLGFLEYVLSPQANQRLVQIGSSLLVILSLAFAWLGARQNAQDVAWIENEMVATAHWVRQNLPADTRLAVHDIGALGYYVQNPLVDLAGLVTPEVISFIRDEDRLADYLDANDVDYLITFPSFYPQLTARKEVVFEAGGGGEPSALGESMRVYRWK
jgi:hypothetical protein